jgi:hypothetical protein
MNNNNNSSSSNNSNASNGDNPALKKSRPKTENFACYQKKKS